MVPKLACRCGFVHNLSPIPDKGWVTVRDADYEELIKAEQSKDAKTLSPSTFVRLTGRLYDCPQCHGIMWEKPGMSQFIFFRPESLTEPSAAPDMAS